MTLLMYAKGTTIVKVDWLARGGGPWVEAIGQGSHRHEVGESVPPGLTIVALICKGGPIASFL